MLLMAPKDWLRELAKGTIKTQWGDMMKAENPPEETDKVYNRLRQKYNHKTVYVFLIAAPLLAERLAIAEYKAINPRIEPVAPEVLSYQEALSIAIPEVMSLTEEEEADALHLLKTDETMKVIH